MILWSGHSFVNFWRFLALCCSPDLCLGLDRIEDCKGGCRGMASLH